MPTTTDALNATTEETRTRESIEYWKHLIWGHDECDRVYALKKHARKLDDASFWQVLGQLWCSQKVTHSLQSTYARLFRYRRPKREHLMSNAEREIFSLLPKEFTVFRGYAMGDGPGMSWSLDRRVACWFAHRESLFRQHSPKLLVGSVRREHAWAYFYGYGEHEILAPHDAVRVLERLPADPGTGDGCPSDFDLATVLTGPLTLSFDDRDDMEEGQHDGQRQAASP